MDTHAIVKRKVTAKVDHISPRPPSPTKSHPFFSSSFESSTVRPKAKVSSSANLNVQKKPSGSSASSPTSIVVRRNPSPPRSRSPFKPPEIRSGRSSPVAQLKRPLFNISPDTRHLDTSESRYVHSSLTPSTSSPSVSTTPTRLRHASVSSVSYTSSSSSHVNKFSDVSSSASQLSPIHAFENMPPSKPQSVRIKSKVTGQAKVKAENVPNDTIPANSLQIQRETSNSPSSRMRLDPGSRLPTPVYPITTSVSNANTHRFTGARVSPHLNVHSFQSLAATDDNPPQIYIDPYSIPLPSQSPPASVLSFSSLSSVSQPSTSSSSSKVHHSVQADDTDRPVSKQLTSMSMAKNYFPDAYDAPIDEERKERTEAKTNRKIADLEITNKSLLSINATLEATKHKQAKEIRDLRRRLRESRLFLPSHAFQVINLTAIDNDDEEGEGDDDDDDDDDDDKNDDDYRSGNDEVYKRVKTIIETLLKNGRQALETERDDLYIKNGGAKVLHEVEARAWRDHGRAKIENISFTNIDQQLGMASEENIYDSGLPTNTNLIKAEETILSGSENGRVS